MRIYFHLPFIQTDEGVVKAYAGKKAPSIPDYSTINRRVNKLDIKINERIGNDIVIVFDINWNKLQVVSQNTLSILAKATHIPVFNSSSHHVASLAFINIGIQFIGGMSMGNRRSCVICSRN